MRHQFTIDKFIASQQMQVGLTKTNHQLLLFVEVNLKQQNLFSIFFKSNGSVLIHAVDESKTIDHNYYIENCLKPVVKEMWKQKKSSSRKGIKLLDDNIRPDTHSDVINYLTEEGIIIMSHPSYSPDLSSCDYWLNDDIKRNLTDQPDEKSLARAVVSKVMKKFRKKN